ncbi:restriction endonuclease subunit S [Ensifer sp. PDNC004]|uniref:restriction endonuclease subunit S n=1 Tax=Ensifer sp. PDNC004 TaxID=2811423 RepID=UPI0019642AC1|nr:restriction endonuclease subunit S [Ensifer sp. PDNC004]QRY67290.1 restriction endonuclease subunit S [Ensifer sp. PDNC004]
MLQLAVRGKLTSTSSDDDNILSHLSRADDFVSADIASGVGAKRKEIEFDLSTPPFEIPSSWQWVRLDTIASYIQRGKSPTYADSGSIKIISQKCIQWTGFADQPCRWLDADAFKKFGRERIIRDGDLLWNSTGTGTIGRIINFDGAPFGEQIFVADSHVTVVRLALGDPKYVWCCLASPDVQRTLESDASGSTNQVELSTSYVRNTWVPFPPLAEQKRIVAKVGELMALCDTLEERRDRAISLKRATAASALIDLNEANTAEATAERWDRIAPRFSELFDELETIEALRGTILDLVTKGRFSNGAASSVNQYEAIRSRIEDRVAQKKIRKPKQTSGFCTDTLAPLPDGWRWVQLGDLCWSVTDGPHFSPKYVDAKIGVPFISTRNIVSGKLDFSGCKFISRLDHEEFSRRTKPEHGDLLYTKGGTTGVAAVNRSDKEFSVWVHIAVLKFDHDLIVPEYLAYTLNSPRCYKQSQEFTQGIGNRDLGLTRLINIILPLPPVAEQKRIVARIDELMALCDLLEEQVREGERLNTELLASLVHTLSASGPEGGNGPRLLEPVTGEGAVSFKSIKAPPANVVNRLNNRNDPRTTKIAAGGDEHLLARSADVDSKFKEAVLVGAIVKAFFEAGGEPIGNFRLQKAVYFARRHSGEHALNREFARKAAGPYNPSMKHSGGIAIAKQKNWLREARGRYGFGHVPGGAAAEMKEWIDTYAYGEIAGWVADQFRFKKNEDWETLATVDYAIEHMRSLGVEPNASKVLDYIRADDEWRPKIEKLGLTEFSIQSAIIEIKALFEA